MNTDSSHPDSFALTPTAPNRRKMRRVWWFRIGAVLFGLLLLVALEAVFWCFGWGKPSHAEDPFVGFREIHPLFEPDADSGQYAIPPARLKFFASEAFPIQKGENTFRIFCFGESTVHGHPWSKETSFTTFLELGLKEADPSRDWEVINCGGVSYASYRLGPILSECVHYQPDLFILCVGHNEFLEDRTYGHIKNTPAVLAIPQKLFGNLRTYTVFRQLAGKIGGPSSEAVPQLPAETDPILDYKDSLKAYRRDSEWHRGVIAHYEANLRRMVAISQEASVPILVVLPPSNLGDCAPFKSEHREGLSVRDRKRFHTLLAQAGDLYKSDLRWAVAKLKSALELDDEHAATWYELGQCYLTLGLANEAKAAFVKARDEDICPLRILSPMEEALRRVALDSGTPFLDAHALLEADCRWKILDGKWLVDHVHPSIPGYQKIADGLVEKLAEEGICDPQTNWQAKVQEVYDRHVESLGPGYYAKSMVHLDMLQRWTRGQIDGPPAEKRFPHLIQDGPE